MIQYPSLLCNFMPLARMLLMFLMDVWRFLRLCLRPSPALAAENLFLRKQLALYQERQTKRFDRAPNHGIPSQRWVTFVDNHAKAIVACDFCTVVTAIFRLLYVFVLLEHATRRMLHCHVTMHPTAQWTIQQLREVIPADHQYRFLIHDRDGIFSHDLDQRMGNMGLRVLRTPVRSPQANSLSERLLGTLRRECLDLMIPLTECHLRRSLHEWVRHYNAGRPHMVLGPGIPQPPPHLPMPLQEHRHRLPAPLQVVAIPVLGGLHHEYQFTEKAA
jgi:transposase InsO family protein